MASLFEYRKEYDELMASCIDDDGVIDESKLTEGLQGLEVDFKEKVNNCISYYKSKKALAEAIKNEKQNLAKRQQQAEKEMESMKKYLTFCLQGTVWESEFGNISYRTSKTVEISEDFAFPEEYTIIEKKPDKTKIKADIEQGVIIDGATVETHTNTIIK